MLIVIEMEYEDYPKHVRQHWKDVESDWEKAFDLRGRKRYAARNNVRDYFCGKLHGFEIRNENDRKHFEKEMVEAKWKSDEHLRANYCCDKLVEEQMKNSKLRDENYALCLENEAQRTQLAAIDSQLKELEAKFHPSEPSSPQKAGVNQVNAPRRLN